MTTKVVMSGIFFPMAILRYFEAALKRNPDVELVTVGPFTGRDIPWAGGMELDERYALAPDIILPPQAQIPFAYVEPKLPWTPDVWIQIDAGWHIKGHPTNSHTKNVFVATDPHCLNYDQQRQSADYFFCTQTPYQKGGDHFLPYAYDPVWHKYCELKQERPAALVGMRYQNRDMLIAALSAQSIDVLYQNGPVFEEANMIYNTSGIGLNWSSMLDTNARCYEVMSMACAAVLNRTPDLMNMFTEGEHFLGFDAIPEAVQQVKKLLHDEPLRKRISNAGRIAVEPHTYDARIKTILEEVV
jgi:hypothetical protein